MYSSTVDTDKEVDHQPSLTDPRSSRPECPERTVAEGVVDVLPIPSYNLTNSSNTDPSNPGVASTVTETPTLSHRLAVKNKTEKGAAQHAHMAAEVLDIGWHEKKKNIVSPLMGGIGNEELWLLIRRFNKQMYHVKAVDHPVPGNLDINIADDEEFSPDKLRANMERLYMTIIIGTLAAYKHVARIRSWRETHRTAVFAATYFIAWFLDLLAPLSAIVLLSLILSTTVRDAMFPPAPIALVSSNGGVQKPMAGVLGSHDSATGAPENHKGEATEAEASNFVNVISSVALSSVAGKHPQVEPRADADGDGDGTGDAAPDPTALAVDIADAKDVASGAKPDTKYDKTRVPMETAMWTKMRPIMHGLADAADTWERIGNALSPTPPFPKWLYRIRLAALVAPLLLMSLFVTPYMFVKGVMFGVGFGFFGDPVISYGLNLLNRRFPHWQKILELRNTLLKGCPTNAQLTLTLLRIGEANKAPLPPPPRQAVDNAPPPMQPAHITDAQLRSTGAGPPLNATPEELNTAVSAHSLSATAHETTSGDITDAKDVKHGKKGNWLLGLFKGTTKGTVKTAIGADNVLATLGSHHAKERVGVISRARNDLVSGPVEFKGRFGGKRGHVYITTKATIPAVAFSTDSNTGSEEREVEDLHPVWSIPIGDIRELKKVGGFGWKTKIVVGWSLGREVADGLEITDRTGETLKVTALPLRDELFNRLVAIGSQKWEAW